MSEVVHIYRYPVKGLSGNELEEVALVAGKGIAFDRAYALAHGETEFNPENPVHLSKRKFLMLMTDNRLAGLKTVFFDKEERLVIRQSGKEVLDVCLRDPADQKTLNEFFESFMEGKARGGIKLVMAKGHMFADIPDQNLSIINMDSVRDFEEKSGLSVDPARFRGNLYVQGLGAWREFDLLDREFSIGSARFRGKARIDRCAAVNVNLDTTEVDMNIPLRLRKLYGHLDMGIYADVIAPGIVTKNDRIEGLS